jgi:hypothetical protein
MPDGVGDLFTIPDAGDDRVGKIPWRHGNAIGVGDPVKGEGYRYR